MKNSALSRALVVPLCLSAAAMQPLAAALPALDNMPWVGYFAVFENKHFQFGVTTDGKIKLTPLDNKGAPMAQTRVIPIEIVVEEIPLEEIPPEGKPTLKKIQTATLESAQPATAKLEKVVIRGKVAGDSSFECTIEQTHGVISMGGRLLAPGAKQKHPLRLTLCAKFPAAYKAAKKDKRSQKTFQQKVEDDRIELKWTDGKRKKQTFEQAVDASSKELNGPGCGSVEIDCSAYNGKKLIFEATGSSAMTLANPKSAPLYEGFTIQWRADAAKDPDGKARFSFELK